MGLYLCIFDDDNEVEGVEVGTYEEFGQLRDFIARDIEEGKRGSRFPTLMLHSDADGEWSPDACERLRAELNELTMELKARPPIPFVSEAQKRVAKSIGLVPKNAFESFLDVDGEPVIERLQALVDVARKRALPILFQ